MGENVLIVGLGEVGRPLLDLIAPHHSAHGIDIQPPGEIPRCGIMHLCFPYTDRAKFISEAVRYVATYRPELTIINSTIGPGATRAIATQSGASVVYSPVRGKHVKMKEDMLHYVKFVGSLEPAAGERACQHFQSIGMKTRLLGSPEAAELAKLTETTFFGVMIAWAQEVERYCQKVGASYDEVVSFYEEIGFFPRVKYFPGVIGGHCVMPNIKILKQHFPSGILEAIEKSNELKTKNLGPEGWNQ